MEYSHFHPTNSFPAESEDFIFTSHGIYTYKLGGLPGHPGEGSHCTAWSWAQDFTGLSQLELISKCLHRPVLCVCCLQCLLWQIVLTSVLYRNRVNRMNIYDNIWQRKCNGLTYMVPGSPKMAVCTLGGGGREPHNCSVHEVGCLSSPYLERRESILPPWESIFHPWCSLLWGASSTVGTAYWEEHPPSLVQPTIREHPPPLVHPDLLAPPKTEKKIQGNTIGCGVLPNSRYTRWQMPTKPLALTSCHPYSLRSFHIPFDVFQEKYLH